MCDQSKHTPKPTSPASTDSMAAASPLPRIQAAAHLPPVISFSSPEEPALEIVITLTDSPNPITVLNKSLPWKNEDVLIRNARTGAEPFSYLQGVTPYRPGGPLQHRLTRAQEKDFGTLQSEGSTRHKYGFRPLGGQTPEQARNPQGGLKYRSMLFGMHALEIGEEYTVAIRPGLTVNAWMEGSKEDLMVEEEGEGGGERKPRTEKIGIETADPVTFRVEA